MFPELLGAMFIINTPGLFSYVWKAFAPLLDPRTTDKIKIFSKQKDWQPALLQIVDAEVRTPANTSSTSFGACTAVSSGACRLC